MLDRGAVAAQLVLVLDERLGGMVQLVVEHPPHRAEAIVEQHQTVDAQRLAGLADRHLVAGPAQRGAAEEAGAGRAREHRAGDAGDLGWARAEFVSRSQRRRIDLGRPQRGTGPAGPFEQAVHGAAKAGRFGVGIGDGSDGRRRG